jgi:hypothetical protein
MRYPSLEKFKSSRSKLRVLKKILHVAIIGNTRPGKDAVMQVSRVALDRSGVAKVGKPAGKQSNSEQIDRVHGMW